MVEIVRDFPRRTAFDVFLKDAPDYSCLCLDHNSFATSSSDRGVSVCQATPSQTLLDPPGLATTHFVRVVLTIELSDQAAKADQHGVNDAFVDRPDLDPEKG
ncbi:hypothetical protein XI03_11525 [Bradyrhizobium sp. CCBAU 65884]|nr:hypothetical protein [Bradyrhizobium sp. CCBAU 65884]